MHAGELPAPPLGSGTGASIRILAVDDDPTSRMLTRATLEDHLGKVTEAENGLLAVQTLERQEFDLAIVDLDMPVMDGFGVIERARARAETRHLPIIVVTGRDDVVAIERAFALGATSFLCKPINWNVFRHQVRYVLQVARREREARVSKERAERLALFQERAVAALTKEVEQAVTKITFLSGKGPEASLTDIFTTGERLQTVLTRLKRASDVVTGGVGLRLEVIEAAALADQAVQNLKGRSGLRAAERIEIPSTTATEILCDRELAVEALEEILVNALTFSVPGEKVRLNVVDAALNRVRFEIEDRGPGIPEHILAGNFEAFISNGNSQDGGLRVGLAMVKAILERHGGHFGMMSEPGRGTEAFLSFPAAVDRQHGEEAVNGMTQMSRGKLSEAASVPVS